MQFLSNLFQTAYPAILLLGAVIGGVLSAFNFHHTPYSILGFFFTRKFKPAKRQHKYAILIPARNEESVIGNLIDSIHRQNYPQELLTIFVVADNCNDDTAKAAERLGAICYQRFDKEHRTKGYALQFLFENIQRDYGIESFEGYFVFDADNLLKEDYIARMNDSFDAGEKIITSYRNTKNFSESWIASTYALHWLRSIRWNHRARSFLHLATNIQGTGFLFANEIVKDGWKYTSLTEDRALTADCVVQGYEISYNDAAEFYDEQPNSLRIALRQRLRWSKGHLMAFAESGWGLFCDIFQPQQSHAKPDEAWYQSLWRNVRHRFMAFDTLAQLVPKDVIGLAKWLLTTVIFYPFVCYQTGLVDVNLLQSGTWIGKLLKYLQISLNVNISAGMQAYLTCLAVVLWARLFYRICRYLTNIWIAAYLFVVERKRIVHISLPKKILYCFTWPIFDIIGRYTQYCALFVKVTWKPIPHESKITMDDIKVGMSKQ